MSNFKCKECDKEFNDLFGLKVHRGRIHKIPSEQTYIDYNLNGILPKCKCGCNKTPKFLGISAGFREYISGHNSKVNNNYQSNPEIKIKSAATQKRKHASGETVNWIKGLTMSDPRVKALIDKTMGNPNRNKKISDYHKDKPKSQEHKDKLSNLAIERWKDPKRREAQSHARIKWMRENDYTIKSKLEEIFMILLEELDLIENIDFVRQHYIKEIKGFFDFKLVKFNILIEIDGDFWHCNPDSKFIIPKYEAQRKNLIKDEIKNRWCKVNNTPLYRFWENDIKNNYDDVVNKIKELIKY